MNDARLLANHRSCNAVLCAIVWMGALGLASCGGSSSSSAPVVPTDAQLPAETEEGLDVLGTLEDDPVSDNQVDTGGSNQADNDSQTGTVGLVVATVQRCEVVYEPLEVIITRKPADDEEALDFADYPNITDMVKFDQSLGTSLNLVSRADGSAYFEMSAQDIVGLTASVENGSVTIFYAGYESDSPSSFIMRKRAPNGCLYAFKSEDYCATGYAKSGSFSLSRNGVSMTATGCELENPDNLPLLEIQ